MTRNKLLAAASFAFAAGASVPFAVAQIAPPESVETAQLPTDPFSIGGLQEGEQALPGTLWSNADPRILDFLLSQAPARPASPSLGKAMRRTLLSPGAKPAGADASLGGKKLLALARAGFIDEARNISSLATTGRNDLVVAEAEATLNLLSGDAEAACRRGAALSGGREAIFWVRLRAFCYARAKEFDAFDLTMNLLRERGALSSSDEALFFAAVAGTPPKAVPPIETPLQYAALKAAGVEMSLNDLAGAEGGVIAAVANDSDASDALRIEAMMRAVAMGVMEPSRLNSLFNGLQFEVADLAAASDVAVSRPDDPVTDALLYQSITAMTAPEFIRDKAQRISVALSRADSFHRAYALSHLYADEISSLEGVIVSPQEASSFAMAAMATGDSVGAGRWLTAMIGANDSVAALPEALGIEFIDRVNLLALLDPQTASRIARGAGVSLLSSESNIVPAVNGIEDPTVKARILEAAFDAVAGEKAGQAGLAALAASSGNADFGGEVEEVIIEEGLDAAGMPELASRHRFERAMEASFASAAAASGTAASSEERGFTPRIKPPKSR
ncbi:hypothetical protein [Hyphococcus sp.]|jgi:hypothetical protein|uniref:hypothetical protein n=1 Tax=Hyphococcus sp. TaxID=2038636 RepID=UPI003D128790